MPGLLRLAVLDVNETLFDLESLRVRLESVGAPGALLETWFASTLRDGFALTASGGYADFRSVGRATLGGMLAGLQGIRRPPGEAADHVLDGFVELDPHPDVAAGLRRLSEGGLRVVTLTNGSVSLTERLLERADLADLVERRFSVDAIRRWKPAAEPYLYAVRECGVAASEAVLVAAHPWDVDGAMRAGLRGGWLNRTRSPYPGVFTPPDTTGASLPELAGELIAPR